MRRFIARNPLLAMPQPLAGIKRTRMIEHKNIEIKDSNSKLGFATTEGGSWTV